MCFLVAGCGHDVGASDGDHGIRYPMPAGLGTADKGILRAVVYSSGPCFILNSPFSNAICESRNWSKVPLLRSAMTSQYVENRRGGGVNRAACLGVRCVQTVTNK